MLIVNDVHLCPGWADRAWRSGVTPARSRLSAYPLVMSDDARADRVPWSPARSRLATDLLVDLATFFHPPTLYQPVYVLTPPDAASAMMACGVQVPAGWRYPCSQHTFVR
jgi:hypothetical protein